MQIYYCNDWPGEATTDSKKRKEKKKEKGRKVSPLYVLVTASSYTWIKNLLENCPISSLTLITISAPNDLL